MSVLEKKSLSMEDCVEILSLFLEFETVSERFSSFKSDNVKIFVLNELSIKGEKELKKKEQEMLKLMKGFNKEEHEEYMYKMKDIFELRYIFASNEVKMKRMKFISEISLKMPIDIVKPILYIEMAVLTRYTSPFNKAEHSMSMYRSLDSFIKGKAELMSKGTVKKKKKK